MPPKSKGDSSSSKANKRKNGKQPTQRTPMQRVMVVGPTGKRRMEWRPW